MKAETQLSKSSTPPKKAKLATTTAATRVKDVSFEEDILSDTNSSSGETILLESPRSPDTSGRASNSSFLSPATSEDEEQDILKFDYKKVIQKGKNKQQKEQPEEDSASVVSITQQMKTTKIASKPTIATYMPISHPIILTKYQDAEKRNWMLNIEFHLPSCSVRDDFEPFLEKRNDGNQYLVFKERMSLDFMFPEFFEAFLPDDMSDKDKASLTLARQDQVKKMKEKFCGGVEEADGDDIYMMSSLQLPFECDDVFTIAEADRYPNTMFDFNVWTIADDNEEADGDNNGEGVDIANAGFEAIDINNNEAAQAFTNRVDKMKVFVIRLVKKEKVKERACKSTPKRRVANQLIARRTRRGNY